MAAITRLIANLLIACAVFGSSSELAAQSPSQSQPRGQHRQTARPGQARSQPASAPVRRASHEVMLAPGATNFSLEPIPGSERSLSDSDGIDSSNFSGCDSCGMAVQCCCNPAGFLFDWTRADLWAGVTSFSNPGNFLTTGSGTEGQVEGSFGFQEGFNFGSRMPSLLGGQVGAQIGMRFTHTQNDGTASGPDNRTQAFLTAGLFRRVDYGFQGGLVVDYLHDDWLYSADLLQLRGELSYLFSPCHDFGFRFTDSQQTDHTTAAVTGRATPVELELSALNTYRFFYRFRFSERGRGLTELHAGFTEDQGGLLGIDLQTPLQGQLGLTASATYLLPPSESEVPFAAEGWNIGFAFIWTPGRAFGTARDYYRPLLNVANNGSLISRLAR